MVSPKKNVIYGITYGIPAVYSALYTVLREESKTKQNIYPHITYSLQGNMGIKEKKMCEACHDGLSTVSFAYVNKDIVLLFTTAQVLF